MAVWNPAPGDHWIFDNVSDQPGRIRPGLIGRERDARREMIEDARRMISQGWRVVRSGRDTVVIAYQGPRTAETVGYPATGERRTLSVRACPGPPVCTSCQRVHDESREHVQRLLDQGIRSVKRSTSRGGRRRGARRR